MQENASNEHLLRIQRHFHEVIRGRAERLIEANRLVLPELAPLLAADPPEGWFPIPGMYGGFRYWLVGEGAHTKLMCESWCRVVEGSGERHEITADGSVLMAEGFV